VCVCSCCCGCCSCSSCCCCCCFVSTFKVADAEAALVLQCCIRRLPKRRFP
jgi:hypothetical protein